MLSLEFNCRPRLWPSVFALRKLTSFNFLSGAFRPGRGHAEYVATRRR
jgi:hypothetical protein